MLGYVLQKISSYNAHTKDTKTGRNHYKILKLRHNPNLIFATILYLLSKKQQRYNIKYKSNLAGK